MITTLVEAASLSLNILEFRADRAYDVYALDGIDAGMVGAAKIELGCSSCPIDWPAFPRGPLVILAQGVTCGPDPICWSGHFVLLPSEILFARFTNTVTGDPLLFRILLIPMAKAAVEQAKAEEEAKGWLP